MANLEDLIDPEYGLQQDRWSLTRPKFGEHGQLEVIGWSGKLYTSFKKYIVKCSICSKDSELFGEGLFCGIKANLLKSLPCGCSTHPKWSKQQTEVRCKRAIEVKGHIFVDLLGDFMGHNTKVRLKCKEHGEWETTVDCVYIGSGCPSCWKNNRTSSRITPEQKATEVIENYCKKMNTRFLGYVGVYTSLGRAKLRLSCPKHGDYVSNYKALSKGGACKECSKERIGTASRFNRVGSEVIQQDIKTFLLSGAFPKGTRFERSPSRGGRKGTAAYWDVSCPECNTTVSVKAAHLRRGLRSCACSSHRQREAYINTITDRALPVALKFGITNDTANRILQQKASCMYAVENVGIWEFETKEACLAAERECKRSLECGVLTKEEMPDGYTETTWVYNLEKIIAIYEKHGGVRVEED